VKQCNKKEVITDLSRDFDTKVLLFTLDLVNEIERTIESVAARLWQIVRLGRIARSNAFEAADRCRGWNHSRVTNQNHESYLNDKRRLQTGSNGADHEEQAVQPSPKHDADCFESRTNS
jgi:hypothetical protein